MGATAAPIIVLTVLWGIVAIILPIIIPLFFMKGPEAVRNKSLVRLVLILTGATCWIFWLCCYMAQMNPLIGPRMANHTILLIAREWGNPIEYDTSAPINGSHHGH